MGNVVFAHIRDGHGELQLYLHQDELGSDTYDTFLKLYDLGDIIGASGTLFCTRLGEISLAVRDITMLAKGLNTLPDKWHGLTDIEMRHRART